MTKRQVAFDLAKMAMMLWVVWGHLGLYGIVDQHASVFVLNAKIGVNMPVFFVMSGFFAASTFAKANWTKILCRTALYVWPHLTIPLTCALLWIIVGGMDIMSAINNVHLYWFLRTLAMIYLLCAVIYCFSRNDLMRWVLFVVTYVAMLFWPRPLRFWWCAQVIHMYPYFVFGLMVLSRHRIDSYPAISLACGVAFLSVSFFAGDFISLGMNFWQSSPYWEAVLFDLRCFVTFFARTAVGICGSIFVLFLANVVEKRIPWTRLLAPLGLSSLGVYVLHEYPLILVHKYAAFTPAPAWSRWIIAIGWFLVCHFTVVMIKRSKYCRFFVFGDEDWLRARITQFALCRKETR